MTSGRWDKQKPILAPQKLFLTRDELLGTLKQYPRIRVGAIDGERSPGPGRL